MSQYQELIASNQNQQTRRSMIPHTDSFVPSIEENNINDILALQLSDTLINAAYQLSAMNMQLAIQKICVLQKLFIERMAWGYQGIIEWGNRQYNKRYFFQLKQEDLIQQVKQQENAQSSQSSISIVKQRNKLIVLTKQQQQQCVLFKIRERLQKIMKIIDKKMQYQKYYTFCLIQQYDYQQDSVQLQQGHNRGKSIVNNKFQSLLASIKPTTIQTNKFQQISTSSQITRQNNIAINNSNNSSYNTRRSIDKNPTYINSNRPSHNHQVTALSLNKNYQYQYQRSYQLQTHCNNNSPVNNNYSKYNGLRINKNSNNVVQNSNYQQQSNNTKGDHSYNKVNSYNNNKQSTCSQSSSTTPQQDNQYNNIKNNIKTSNNPNNLQNGKCTKNTSFNNQSITQSSQLNPSKNTKINNKQKQLQQLRKKYSKLVNEFKHFTQRFLTVIKQQS